MTAQPDVSLQLTDTEQPAARDFISRKLGEFNHAMTGRADAAALDVYVTDPVTGEVPCEPEGAARVFMVKTL